MKGVNGKQRPRALLAMLPPWNCAPLPPSLSAQSISCRTWLSFLEPGGGSTACGWTDLRGDTEFSVSGGDRQPGVTPRQTHHAVRPGSGILGNGCPTNPPPRPRTHGGWSCGKFPPLRRVPQFWEGTNRRIRMDQERQSLPRSSQSRLYFPNRTRDLDMGTVRPNQEALCCCFGVRQEMLPTGLRDVGEGT